MEKTFKYRIYPTEEQIQAIENTLQASRYVFNYFLHMRNEAYKNGEKALSCYDYINMLPVLKKEHPWLADADSSALQKAVARMDRSVKVFFKARKKNPNLRFPSYQPKKKATMSYTVTRCKWSDETGLSLPKIGAIQTSVSRPIEGRILNATIVRTNRKHYYVCLCCTDIPASILTKTGAVVGLFFDVEHCCMTTSDGDIIEFPQFYQENEKFLSRLQRWMNRKQKGGKNYEKARLRLAKRHEKIANQRKYFLNVLSAKLIRRYDTIYIPDMDIAALKSVPDLAKNLTDMSISMFIQMLTYKAAFADRKIVIVPMKIPQSKTKTVDFIQPASADDILELGLHANSETIA